MITQENIQDKIRAILERANHPNTPKAEAETALAIAYRLMHKYDLEEDDVTKRSNTNFQTEEITKQTFEITGPYRVRRGNLLYTIAKKLSCAAYRDQNVDDYQTVIMVAYGTPNDLFALETLFQAAEMLALRTIPYGDRCFRTSWWHGFCSGIARKLEREYRVIIKESPGVGLVLVERAERARRIMHDEVPSLGGSTSSYVNDKGAYGAGRRAGSRFSTGRNGIGGQSQIGSG